METAGMNVLALAAMALITFPLAFVIARACLDVMIRILK
jgi:hypothetical protein